ncbi:MAG: hypothetical protein ABIH42_04490 [Planctomycetota bacterium]
MIKNKWFVMLTGMLLVTGCTMLSESSRYQVVNIDSNPSGAKVTFEGEISPAQPLAVKEGDKLIRVSAGKSEFVTPVSLIVDKESKKYIVTFEKENYPTHQVLMETEFRLHPYLIIIFPVIPLLNHYEIFEYKDVYVDLDTVKQENEQKPVDVLQPADSETPKEVTESKEATEPKEEKPAEPAESKDAQHDEKRDNQPQEPNNK